MPQFDERQVSGHFDVGGEVALIVIPARVACAGGDAAREESRIRRSGFPSAGSGQAFARQAKGRARMTTPRLRIGNQILNRWPTHPLVKLRLYLALGVLDLFAGLAGDLGL